MKRILKFIALSLLSLSVFSCKVIGLGEAVDLTPPVLTVTKPEIASSVPQTIVVEGSAQDNLGIKYLQVSIDETDQAFKYELASNKWTQKSGETWIDYTGGNAENNEGVISFTVVVEIANAHSGKDYTVITQAWDDMLNEGKDSRDERVVTVDMEEPTLSISEPALFDTYNEVSTQSANFELKNNAVLTYLYNQDITVNGSTKEDSKIDHLVVYFDTGTSDTPPAKETDIFSYIYKKEITGSNLRNWSFTVRKTDLPAAYQSGKKIIRVVTYAYDVAGNVEKKVAGYFVYWNEADKPWITATYGVDTLSSVTEDTYPGSVLIGQVFDDDGIKEVTITTKQYTNQNDTTGTVVNALTRTITDTSTEDGLKDHPKYYTYQANAIGEAAYFSVEVKCKDINGFESEAVTKYLHVANVVAPTIKITSASQIPLNKTSFNIEGEINAPGGHYKLLIFRKPETLTEQEEVKYLNGYSSASDNVWNVAINNAQNGLYTDASGNKIWVVSNFTDTQNQMVKTFKQTLNWETDFGITSTNFATTAKKLTTQTFIICAVDASSQSRTVNLTMNGDSTKPVLTIDKVEVFKANGSSKQSKNLSNTPELDPYNRDTSNAITDKVQLSGTWSDDSNYVSPIELTWTNCNETITITKNTNGTWVSNKFTPPDLTTAVLTAEITDLGGNKTTSSASFYVNGSMAQYLRISSDTPDATYKAGDEIKIYIQFTKAAEFKGSLENQNPELVLSNGAKAVYDSGNGTEKHVFKYTIASSDSNLSAPTKLNVTKITTKGHKWYDGNNVFYNSDGASEITTISSNLNQNKAFYIDTQAPKITSITKSTGDGSYKVGSKLYFIVTFNENVSINNFEQMKLQLNTGNNKTSDVQTTSEGNGNTFTFNYTVVDGDAASQLQVTGIDWGTVTIKDIAQNEVDKTNSVKTATFAGLSVDTQVPNTPTFTLPTELTNAVGTTKVMYATEDKNLVINFAETSGTKKWTRSYSATGTNNWSDYTGPISLSAGEWTIAAYQEDAAGNKSNIQTYSTFEVDKKGHILNSVTVDKPAAAYSSGETFTFTLNFRKEIKSSNAKIKINIGANGKEISPQETANTLTNKLTFKYTSAAGDALTTGTTKLAVTAIEGTFKDTYENVVTDLCALSGAGVKKFEDDKTITIDTNIPTVSAVTLDGTDLKITFNSSTTISKGTTTSDVVLTMSDDYKAPPYFTKEQWSNYSGDSTIASYYSSNTLGCDEDYNADLTEKFVLNFDKAITDATLTDALKTAGADKASMSVNSSDVSVASDGKTLVLKFGTKIPVKGAKYKVTIPANLIQNSLSKGNTAPTTDYYVTLAGIETPAIRIQKTDTTNASFRIDCQTPGSTITYKMGRVVSSGIKMAKIANCKVKLYLETDDNKIKLTSAPSPSITLPTTSEQYENNATVDLTAGTDNENKGCQIHIEATATKAAIASENYDAANASAYESAMKTVIRFINRGTPTGYTYRAIRGGDNTYGGVSTPNFPFSWNVNEPDGMQVMEGNGNTNGSVYYWRTWRLTTTAYINFLAVSTNSNPTQWWWASCGWVPDVANYPVYPGEHTEYDANGVCNTNSDNGGFGFLEKHKQSASNN